MSYSFCRFESVYKIIELTWSQSVGTGASNPFVRKRKRIRFPHILEHTHVLVSVHKRSAEPDHKSIHIFADLSDLIAAVQNDFVFQFG
uniref:Uncharacterized protein n=1 Tax=uncultured marine virus TaxID=186617 RepID=A0A0F7L589_9VIRU|nr:hypothetical protein [uncultured marine virus]